MVFGLQKLQNDIFCLTEERDYFQTKFLEQVSELKALKDELTAAKKEISRLRQEVMNNSSSQLSPSRIEQLVVGSPSIKAAPSSKDCVDKDDDASSLTAEDDDEHLDDDDDDDDECAVEADRRRPKIDVGGLTDDDDDEGKDDDSGRDIRQSAEKLLQWASYRSSMATPRSLGGSATASTDHSSVVSPISPPKHSILGQVVGDKEHLDDKRLVGENDDDDDESEDGGEDDEYSSEEDSQDQNRVPATRAGKLLQKFENVLDRI